MIAGPAGAAAIRGTLIDGRDEYAYFAAHAPAAAGEASILAHAAARSRLPASALRVTGLRLVAFRRTRMLGWAGVVTRGVDLVAHVVVAADPAAVGPAALLYFVRPDGHGLADEVALTVRAEDMASALFEPPIEAVDVSQLPGGAALTGSAADPWTRLADRRVVALDAAGATSAAEALVSPIYGAPAFDNSPGARAFDIQSAYVWLQAFHAQTDLVMHGRWDSLLPFYGLESPVAPGEFSPRLVAALDTAANLCGQAAYCVRTAWGGTKGEPPEALQHPTSSPPYEMVSALYVKGTALSPVVLPHEFGHVVDQFAAPGLFYEPHACAVCSSSCVPGTTDESVPLTETFANLLAMWYYSELFAVAGQSTACDTLLRLSRGGNRPPHSEACRPEGDALSYFLLEGDPACPPDDPFDLLCDRPGLEDIDNTDGLGLCEQSTGYVVDSWHQAFWELLHGETCAPDPPYTCAPLPALAGLPARRAIGEALLFAAQANAGTYDGFADDVAAYIACHYGQAAYDELSEVLCHHRIRACDAPAPVLCDLCGDGVRTGGEACDGGDLAGRACEDFGAVSGQLACDPSCAFDLSHCESPGTTGGSSSGADADTGPVPTTSHTPDPGETEPPGGLFIDPGAPAGDGSGCACRHRAVGEPLALPAGLLLAMSRRRRRR